MSELQWRNGMRVLADPAQPTRDLWPDIQARIAEQTRATRRGVHWRPWAAMAASLIVAGGAALLAQRMQQMPVPAPLISLAVDNKATPDAALGWATPIDPRLALAAQHLDNATEQLQSALEQRPDAVFLVGLLNRTNGQRFKLLRQTPYAG